MFLKLKVRFFLQDRTPIQGVQFVHLADHKTDISKLQKDVLRRYNEIYSPASVPTIVCIKDGDFFDLHKSYKVGQVFNENKEVCVVVQKAFECPSRPTKRRSSVEELANKKVRKELKEDGRSKISPISKSGNKPESEKSEISKSEVSKSEVSENGSKGRESIGKGSKGKGSKIESKEKGSQGSAEKASAVSKGSTVSKPITPRSEPKSPGSKPTTRSEPTRSEPTRSQPISEPETSDPQTNGHVPHEKASLEKWFGEAHSPRNPTRSRPFSALEPLESAGASGALSEEVGSESEADAVTEPAEPASEPACKKFKEQQESAHEAREPEESKESEDKEPEESKSSESESDSSSSNQDSSKDSSDDSESEAESESESEAESDSNSDTSSVARRTRRRIVVSPLAPSRRASLEKPKRALAPVEPKDSTSESSQSESVSEPVQADSKKVHVMLKTWLQSRANIFGHFNGFAGSEIPSVHETPRGRPATKPPPKVVEELSDNDMSSDSGESSDDEAGSGLAGLLRDASQGR